MVLVFGLVLGITAQPTNNAAEEKGKYSADCQSDGSIYLKNGDRYPKYLSLLYNDFGPRGVLL